MRRPIAGTRRGCQGASASETATDLSEAARSDSGSTSAVCVRLPLKTTNPLNGSWGHWSSLAKTRKAQRKVTALTLRAHIKAMPLSEFNAWHRDGRSSAVVALTRIAPSNGLDDDNLRAALKAVRDGVADALGVDDRDPRVTWQYEQRRGKPREYAVELEIR